MSQDPPLNQEKGLKVYWQRFRHYVIYDLLHADDTPHRIALGFALGVFVAFTPTIPFQMILTFIACWIFGGNKAVGIPVVWVTNPATVVPIYLPMYLLGCYLTGYSSADVDFSILAQDHGGMWPYAKAAWELMEQIFWPLWIGSLISSALLGVGSYYFVRYAVIKYRLRRYGSITVPTKEVKRAL